MNDRIPITILSGYLGSGKTTIINNILSGFHATGTAVVVNDFGEVNIDASLIKTENVTTVELTNGCICCSIGDDLGATLSTIAAWVDPPKRVLLEASGIAEPARIAMTAGNWPGYELDAVIVAADAETVRCRSYDKFVGALILSQLRSANIIVLTKTDLLDEEHTDTIKSWLASVAPTASIVMAPNGELSFENLLSSNLDAPPLTQPNPAHPHTNFSTACWRPNGPINIHKLRDFLKVLPDNIHRVKGIIVDKETAKGTLVQLVGQRCEMTSVAPPLEPCLIFISTGPDKQLVDLCAQLRDSQFT